MMQINNLDKKQLLTITIAFLAGVFWLVAVRFVTLTQDGVHYHANFALYVEGERYEFDRFTYYQEVAACGGDGVDNPRIRTHMHDEINHVVHVHDNGATWGHFFSNLGMTHGDTVFRIDQNVYTEDDATDIQFMLNGELVDTTANRTVGDEDVLLISIGNSDAEQLQQQYGQIQQDAAIYNETADPSACSGSAELTFTERLKQAIGF